MDSLSPEIRSGAFLCTQINDNIKNKEIIQSSSLHWNLTKVAAAPLALLSSINPYFKADSPYVSLSTSENGANDNATSVGPTKKQFAPLACRIISFIAPDGSPASLIAKAGLALSIFSALAHHFNGIDG